MPYYNMFNAVLITKRVMCLNLDQIDKASTTLLDVRARCVGNRYKLQEAESNPKTHSVKGQVGNISGKYILSFEGKDQIMSKLDIWC